MLQGFTLKQIADRNRVSKSTVKSFAAAHGFKPIDKSGNAYIYSSDLMATVTEKYGEPANSTELFNQAVKNADSKQVEALSQQVDRLVDFAGWWADFDDQRLVPVYVYRYIFNSKAVRLDKKSEKIMRFFGSFSLNPANEKMEYTVKNGIFQFFAWRIYRIMNKPLGEYAMISRWAKFSDDGKRSVVRQLDHDLSKNYSAYRDFSTGSSDVKGAGVKTPAISAGSSSSSDNSEMERCKTALLADSKKQEKGA